MKVQVPNVSTFAIVATGRALLKIAESSGVQKAVFNVLAEKYHDGQQLLLSHVMGQSERHGYAWFHFDYIADNADDDFSRPCARKVRVDVKLTSGYNIKALWTITKEAEQTRYHEALGEITTGGFGYRDDQPFVFIVKAVDDKSVEISSIKLADSLGEAFGAELLS